MQEGSCFGPSENAPVQGGCGVPCEEHLGQREQFGPRRGQRPVGELLTMVPRLDHSDEYGAEVLAWAPLV